MKKIYFFLFATMVFMTSATIVKNNEITANATKLVSTAADGKISKNKLTTIATNVKGSKLTLKEKLAIKLFGKKIGNKLTGNTAGGEKSQLIALLLCFFVGGIGIHRFYLGYTWQGVVQVLTGGGCGVWALIDLIRIITGDLKPKDSDYDKTL